jgi:hypothetical protein
MSDQGEDAPSETMEEMERMMDSTKGGAGGDLGDEL